MQAKGAGELKYDWTVSGMAVIKEIAARQAAPQARAEQREADRDGDAEQRRQAGHSRRSTIVVKEPKKDAWVQRTPDKDEKPVDNQFYARDDKNEGTLYYNGTLSQTPPTPCS